MQMLVPCGMVRRFVRDENGTTAIEYALIASGISVVIAASVQAIGPVVRGLLESAQAGFN